MSEITEKEVIHLAELARIELKPEEVSGLQKDLNKILEYVAALKEVDTIGLEDVSQVTGLKNVMRSDEIVTCDPTVRDRILEAFPEKENDYLKVKAIFKE